MSCLPCFESKDLESNEQEDMPVAQTKGHPSTQSPGNKTASPSAHNQKQGGVAATHDTNEAKEVAECSARSFGFREVAMATKNFRRESLLGESAFGKVYKGTLQGTQQVVAVKQLDKHGTKANKEFLAEVVTLSHLRHPNLAALIGYCADGDQRILVYEFMQKGSLKDHLHEIPSDRNPLDWITRMKIASGAAQALEYLHENANPPILYRNFKSTNILLDDNLEPKLTDYGLMKLEIDSGNTMHQRVVGTVGCAPEYEQNGELTPKSDVYSFGIVLLELITGRKALDTTRPTDEQNLVIWAKPYFKDQKRYPELADPQLQGAFPERSLNQAVGVAAMCVQEEPSVRPFISDVVAALGFLTVAPPPPPQTNHAQASAANDPQRSPSSSSFEPEQEAEAASSQKDDGTEEDHMTSSDFEDEEEQSPIQTKNNKNKYDDNEDRGDGSSSSESLYNEDDYDDDDDDDEGRQHEETSYRSKSKPKSIKRKVTFETENKKSVSRNSSKGNNKSCKTQNSGRKKRENSIRKSPKKKSHESVSSGSSGESESYKKKRSSRNSSKRFNIQLDSNFSRRIHDIYEDVQSSSESDRESISKSISENKKLENNESSDSSFSSDSGKSSNRVVTFKS